MSLEGGIQFEGGLDQVERASEPPPDQMQDCAGEAGARTEVD